MFCIQCGNKLPEGNRFCQMCGYPVSAPAQPQAPAQQPVYQQPQTQPRASESAKASEIVRSKLIACNGVAEVETLTGIRYTIAVTRDGKGFTTPALRSHVYDFSVFDVIADLLKRQVGKAYKGNGHKYKLGEPGCELTTVVGAIGKYYAGNNEGDSVYDPVFIMSAILEWANICRNERGYITFTADYRSKIAK